MKSVLIAIDFIHESDYSYGLLQTFLAAFPEADVFTLKNYAAQRPAFLNNRFFEGTIAGSPGDFWNYIEKFPRETEKFPWDSYDIVLSVSKGPLRWIKKKQENKPYHIAFALNSYFHVWETVHERKIGTFWDKFDEKDRVMYRQWDLEYNATVDKFIAPGKNIAVALKKQYGASAILAYPPADKNIFIPYPQTEKTHFLVTTNEYLDDGITYVINTFNYIQDSLAILGAGKKEEFLRNKSRSNITFYDAGSDEDYAYYLSSSVAFIAPDERKYNPMVLRALQMGIPVIGLESSNAADHVKHDKNGFLYKEKNENGLMPMIFRSLNRPFNENAVAESVRQINSDEFIRKIRHIFTA